MNLEESICYKFQNKQLLEEALTHTSYAHEKGIESNEKLEFLGDSILEFLSSKYLYNKFPNLREGELTKIRATVVCEDSLYEVAKKHNISQYIKVGHSERINGGANKPTILADSIEAIIAAIYFDGGLEKAEEFILNNLTEAIEIASKNVGQKDYKTVLQERLQKNGDIDLEYKIIDETGPDHDKLFTVEVIIKGKSIAQGVGKSKKLAEMQAAKKALEVLKEIN